MRSERLLRATWLAAVAAAGLLAALGSSTFDDDDDEALPPVELEFTVAQQSASAALDIDVGRVTLTNTRLAGTLTVGANDRLTILRDEVLLDTTSGFEAEITPELTNDPLTGSLDLAVTQVIDFGVDRTPNAGQFSVLFGGTTTVVTILDSQQRVSLEIGAADPVELSWQDFLDRRSLAVDEGDTDEKAASLAYFVLQELWRFAQLSEYVQHDIDDNRGNLEGMGVGENLNLSCANDAPADVDPYVLRWTDTPGTGEGMAGNGDSFEAIFTNCLDSGSDRYRDGNLDYTDYEYLNDATPRTMRYQVAPLDFFYATDEVQRTDAPTDAAPRLSGALEVFVTPVN